MTIDNMFLCTAVECIWNEARGPGPLHTTGPVPQFYYFSGLGEVEWVAGQEVHIWALASEGVEDSSPAGTLNAKWFDLGTTAIQPCEYYGHWCYPAED
jgi:hypothetical protein